MTSSGGDWEVTIGAFARLCGCHPRRAMRWMQEGMPVRLAPPGVLVVVFVDALPWLMKRFDLTSLPDPIVELIEIAAAPPRVRLVEQFQEGEAMAARRLAMYQWDAASTPVWSALEAGYSGA